MIEIDGDYNKASIMVGNEDDVEEGCKDQIEEMINHEAFEGDNDVVIQPDTHQGQGAVIGFTMPLKDKICPSTVGVDISCGMLSAKVEKTDMDLEEIDERIRDVVPTGFNKQNDPDYHILNDFPWGKATKKWHDFVINILEFNDTYGKIGHNYFQETCEKVEYNENTAIASMGTLGGGNHFIEIGEDNNDDWWITIHSGSRGFGYNIADYHQQKATELRNKDNEYDFDREKMEELARQTFEGGKIGEVIHYLKQMQDTATNTDRNTDLDYLEGQEALGYYKDMVLAQTYASENRKTMMNNICNELDIEIKDRIESVHNFIDFEDGIIRKGATRVHKDEKAIIPLNMSDGTLIVEGKGNEDWNKSVCHGAGRVMSRTRAENVLDKEKAKDQMEGIYTAGIPLDEARDAYKPSDFIVENIEDTAKIINNIEPVLNVKDLN